MEVIACFKYKDRYYSAKEEFKNSSLEGILFMMEEGNWSCDCNRSIMIRSRHKDFTKLECGEEVEMLRLIVYDNSEKVYEKCYIEGLDEENKK